MTETNTSDGIGAVAGTGDFSSFLTRRGFMRSGAAAGAGLMLTSKSAIGQSESVDGVINLGIAGCGAQGLRLLNAIDALMDKGVRIVAVCDIWEVPRKPTAERLRRKGFEVEEFSDYEEMLDKRKDLDAVLLPTPDSFHAPYTRMALEKGLAVYCEKMMSNTIEGAADMVRAQRETGGILQIGHQRRSNPRYQLLRDEIIHKHKLLNRITHAQAQWNRPISASPTTGFKPGEELAPEILEKYGYADMAQFRNWRMSKKFGGGIISDLGAHQIDLFNWFFKANPVSVMASGGVDYWMDYELPDNVMAIYEFDLPEGKSRAIYQVLTTTGSQGAYEKFMGLNGTATISELGTNTIYREAGDMSEKWDELGEDGLNLISKLAPTVYNKFWEKPKPWTRAEKNMDTSADATATKPADPWEINMLLKLPPHAPHLANFFAAVRAGKDKGPDMLNCKVEDAYQTCVTVLKIYEALATEAKVVLKPEDFVVSDQPSPPAPDPVSPSPPTPPAPTEPVPPAPAPAPADGGEVN